MFCFIFSSAQHHNAVGVLVVQLQEGWRLKGLKETVESRSGGRFHKFNFDKSLRATSMLNSALMSILGHF